MTIAHQSIGGLFGNALFVFGALPFSAAESDVAHVVGEAGFVCIGGLACRRSDVDVFGLGLCRFLGWWLPVGLDDREGEDQGEGE